MHLRTALESGRSCPDRYPEPLSPYCSWALSDWRSRAWPVLNPAGESTFASRWMGLDGLPPRPRYHPGSIEEPASPPIADSPPDYSAVNQPVRDATSREEIAAAAGLEPVANVSNLRKYWDRFGGATNWKDSSATPAVAATEAGPIDNPLGQVGGPGSFSPDDTRAGLVKLENDLLVVQYYDSSRELDTGDKRRSLMYWEAICPDQLSALTDPARVEAVKERAALLESWGDRNMVQVALIPAGTEIHAASGPAAPQVDRVDDDAILTRAGIIELTAELDAMTPAWEREALEPAIFGDDEILRAIGDARIGGGPQLLFAEFDDSWIIARGPIGS
jgi:hypothetical protein